MKAIMVMFDSLNRHMLPPYGCDWVHAPNFERLAARGHLRHRLRRQHALHARAARAAHRPLQLPAPQLGAAGAVRRLDAGDLLKQNGVHTHLVSDHYHYWEDGGATYHTRYSTWEIVRGQEGDPWKGDLRPHDRSPIASTPSATTAQCGRQDWVNRSYMQREEDQPQPQTFDAGPGVPAAPTPPRTTGSCTSRPSTRTSRSSYPADVQGPVPEDHYHGRHFDWPPYRRVTRRRPSVRHTAGS